MRGSRNNTQNGLAEITLDAKFKYANWLGVNIDTFLDVVNHIDNVYVDEVNKKIHKMTENKSGHENTQSRS